MSTGSAMSKHVYHHAVGEVVGKVMTEGASQCRDNEGKRAHFENLSPKGRATVEKLDQQQPASIHTCIFVLQAPAHTEVLTQRVYFYFSSKEGQLAALSCSFIPSLSFYLSPASSFSWLSVNVDPPLAGLRSVALLPARARRCRRRPEDQCPQT